jgi:uncharacterized pyridoxamine 5'-phosphate oxidase family protein
MLEENDLLKSIYKTRVNPEFEIFYLKHGQAAMFDCYGRLLLKNIF